jgi:beta-glucosidase
LLIDRWRKESYRTETRAVRLQRGRRYRVRVEYFENTGNGRIRLVWDVGTGPDWRAEIRRAEELARRSEVAVVVAGIEEGEFRDRAFLHLPGHQEELIRAVAAQGRPTVVVLVGGSAVTMSEWIDDVGAVLLAWYPGDEGGRAVADVLLGAANPAGRLPLGFPMTEGQVPWTYRHKPTGRGDDYADLTGRPRFPFGFGLSYSQFAYADLGLPSDGIRPGDSLRARLRLTNTSGRAGDEVVQVYLRDEVAPVAQPVLQLAAFARVALDPGESRVITLAIPPERLAILDDSLRWVERPGRFQVMVGGSSADIRLRGAVTIH